VSHPRCRPDRRRRLGIGRVNAAVPPEHTNDVVKKRRNEVKVDAMASDALTTHASWTPPTPSWG